ncbi:hypothetical protein FB567DRAFT_609628 [Paraphoma chrysanthemicola]|uniref:Uncharacterized protein n=1 Tax=Paraphoma chrysanthemicola TaxID=798071 RepID=A0A8K0REU4_9PLEO|nr:hypothetical protein FB567DRAFT_609628 [Paraphoma chrysanthemicola]
MSSHRTRATSLPLCSTIPSPPDSVSSARTSLKRRTLDDSTDNTHSPTPTKKIRTVVPTKPKDSNASHRSRKNATIRTNPASRTTTASITSTLTPRGPRQTASLHQADPSLLRMLCDDVSTNTTKELHFRNLPHSSIDWSNPIHINKINNWRNQIYGRAGMKSKTLTMWLPEEELWIELYFQLSIAQARARGMLLPKAVDVLAAFNRTFAGKLVKDGKGVDLLREERKGNAFTSKFNRMCPHLRARLAQCVFGKSGDVYVPEISMEMLQEYKMMKSEMEARGVVKESQYSNGLEDWTYLFSHLPQEEKEEGTNGAEMDCSFTSEEDDAAAVLVSMALQPVHGREEIKTEGKKESPSVTAPTSALEPNSDNVPSETPDLSPASFLASSQQTAGLATPSRSCSFSGVEDTKLVPTRANVGRCVTPVRSIDVASLIMSPD